MRAPEHEPDRGGGGAHAGSTAHPLWIFRSLDSCEVPSVTDFMKAYWGKEEVDVTTSEDVAAIVSAVSQSQQPTIVFLHAKENGRTLAFGVGHAESVLTFVEPDGRTFHSLGDVNRKGHFVFLCRDRFQEFDLEQAIPTEDALSAANQFLANGEQPTSVRWEADWY
jgi:hypothetical protein